MSLSKVILLLIACFEHDLQEDAAVIGEWLEKEGVSPDQFVADVEKLKAFCQP